MNKKLERFLKNNKLSIIVKQKRKINRLEAEIELYETTLKEDLFELFKELQDAPLEARTLKIEKRRLREKNKELKDKLEKENHRQ